MKLDRAVLFALVVLLAVAGTVYWTSDHGSLGPGSLLNPVTYQRMASPGPMTQQHAFLDHDCAACHDTLIGASDTDCIVCHATSVELLARQPTAFHSDIGSCGVCHREHAGPEALSGPMNHAALAQIGMSQLRTDLAPDGDARLSAARLETWLDRWLASRSSDLVNPRLSGQEITLDCATCHRNTDPHFELFGDQCSDCHDTKQWSLPEFRHPRSSSRDCAQCHQAPPSHYMMHFGKISQGVSGRHDARVDQCFACHQTTSWTDIQRIGTYKHH